MTSMKCYFFSFIFFQILAVQGAENVEVDSLTKIYEKAQISSTDTLPNRTSKFLMLINETETLWTNHKPEGSSQQSPESHYELDSNRSTSEICDQKVGGSCGTMARVFAELLIKSGVPNSNIRIISAVSEPDLKILCEGVR